jgi:starch synthase
MKLRGDQVNILYVTSEVYPFSKTGGLADISYSLPKGVSNHYPITVVTPFYKQIFKYFDHMTFLGEKEVLMFDHHSIVKFYEMHYEGVRFIFVQNMHFFERDNLYGYDDDAKRFTNFSYATLELISLLDKKPDIIHINDWPTGIIPYLYHTHYVYKKGYENIKFLLTIHNLEYQGSFDYDVAKYFNSDFNYIYTHFGRVNFLKAGIALSNKINTVSPNYKNEILTKEFGFTLDGILNDRQNDLVGILNGIDSETFNPAKDKYIINYDINDFEQGKFKNKKLIFDQYHLSDPNYPLVSYIGRYANQKGLWMIRESIEDVINHTNARFFFLGSGDKSYEIFFKYLTDKYPQRVANFIGYNEVLAHQIYAASDLFMMPSEFEPCGLGQMIAMTYGTLPIVRETGGLKDTVIPYNQYTEKGTGFSFSNKSSYELKDRLYEAIYLYQSKPATFKKLIKQAMKKDFSNQRMTQNYMDLYKTLL